MANNELLIKINADAKNVKKAFEDVKEKVSELDSTLSEIAKVSGIAFAALTAEIGVSVFAYKEAEDAAKSLTAALQNQGIFTTSLREEYKSYADEVERLTGIDGDAVTKAQAVAQGFLGQTKVTKELTKAIADLSAAQGIGLDQAATIVSRSIGTSTNALARQGLQLSDTMSKTERYAKVLEFLQGKYGGQAEAAAQGLGALNQLKTAFGNFQEAIGERFAPIISLGAKKMAEFFQRLSENKPLMDLIVSLITAGVAVTGAITAIAIAGKAFLTFQAVASSLGVAVTGLRLGFMLLAGATGIGLLITAVTYAALNWNTVWPRMQAVFKAFVDNVVPLFDGLGTLIVGAFTLNPTLVKAGLEQIKNAFVKGAEEAFAPLPEQAKKATEEQNKVLKEAADKRHAQENLAESRRLQLVQAQNELIKLELENASTAAIDLKKKEIEILKGLQNEDNARKVELLNQQLDETRAREDEQHLQDLERQTAFAEEKAALQAELDGLGIANKDALRAEDLRKSQEALLTEKETERKIAKDILDERVKNRNLELEDRKRYGTAIATINSIMRSTEVENAKAVSGELVALAQSKNATLKSIGKAAAIANITIATAESAVVIAQKVIQALPFPINVPIAAALAGARIAFGAEQISNVTAAASGALVGGSGSGDTQPFMLEPGELVAPKKNFEEVVGSVRASRENRDDEILATLQEINSKSSGGSSVVVNGDVLSDETYIDKLVSKISDAIEFRNAKIYGVNA